MPDRLRTADGFPFRPIFEAAENAMLLVDGEPRVVAANGAAARLLGHPEDSLDGRPAKEITDGDGPTEAWRALLADGAGVLDLRTADGRPIEVDLNVTGRIGDEVHLVIVSAVQRTPPPPTLTTRQEDTLRLLCDGATNQQIAAALGISEPTVQKHIASIKERLGAATRAQVVAIALQRRDLALRIGTERLYVHQAIRTASGEIADTRLLYISHQTRHQQPEMIPRLGTAMGEWYPDYQSSDLFAILVEAIETGDLQTADRVVLRPPWRPTGYEVSAVAAPIGPDRAVFMTNSLLRF